MAALDEFRDILSTDEPMAKMTSFGVGGRARWLAKPRTVQELSQLIRRCRSEEIPYRSLGSGTNVLVPEEGFAGLVIRLSSPAFGEISFRGSQVTAGAGVPLANLISESCEASMSGLEALVGIPGTVGGALRCNAGSRTGDIGQHVNSIEVMDATGEIQLRMRADIRFGYHQSDVDDAIILGATFELLEDDPEDIVKRIKKIWIAKKGTQPLDFQSAGYVFRNPRGLSAVELIEEADLVGTSVGGAEISDRDPRFIIAREGATPRDILRLIDLVRSKVEEKTGVLLELQIDVW